ncbi:MAG: hypothetical protein IJN79_05875 [Clostridia bacterium]|nr:hypothetical protein [Clostridia bacterium]
MTTIQINHKNSTIEMTKKFYTESCKYGSEAYKALQEVRRDYPGYKPVVAKTKKSGTSDPFKGLNYEYMELYIMKHDDEEQSIMAEFKMLRAEDDLSLAMDAESESYLTIRNWFLEQYPAVREFHEKREQVVGNIRMKKEAERLARLEAAKNARREKLLALIA